jgi:hypothetical protein
VLVRLVELRKKAEIAGRRPQTQADAQILRLRSHCSEYVFRQLSLQAGLSPMIRKLTRVVFVLAILASAVVIADWFGARIVARVIARMVDEHSDLATAWRVEQRRRQVDRQTAALQRQLNAARQLENSLSDVQFALSQDLHQERTASEQAHYQAMLIKDCYQRALDDNRWPIEYRGRSYTQSELEAQVRQLLAQGIISQKTSEQLGELKGRLAAEQARLAIEHKYRKYQAITSPARANFEIEAAADLP